MSQRLLLLTGITGQVGGRLLKKLEAFWRYHPLRGQAPREVTDKEGKSRIRQRAIFDPVGPLGRAYRDVVYPVHQCVFVGMLRETAHDLGKLVMSASQSIGERSVSQWLVLALFVMICLGTAGLGAAWTNLSVGDWYVTLNKPSWNPPKWVFGPVWTTLYIMMAIAAWLVWRTKGLAGGWLPLLLFGVQLFLNAAWSALFFGMRSPGIAFADILLLWLAILATIIGFGRLSNLAALLLVPYLAWVSFATALNWSIWRMNP